MGNFGEKIDQYKEMTTRADIERSFADDPLYEYAYHAASNVFWPSEEDLWNSDQGYRLFYLIQTEQVKFRFSREDYDKNADIQNSLALIGLDPDKFWQAILYISAIAFERNADVTPVRPSAKEHIRNLISALEEEGAVISIGRPDKKPTAIVSDTNTKHFLSLFLRHEDDLFSALGMAEYNGREIMIHRLQDNGIRWQIYDEYCAFKSIFDKYCTDGNLPKRISGQKGSRDKDLLISRILYMTKVVDNEQYTKTRNPLHSVVGKCQEAPRPRVNWEMYAGGINPYTKDV